MFKSSPLVSIIIPVYNSQLYVGRTVASCLNQTYANIEIIVVNDGSTDESASIVTSLESEKIRFFDIENRGACEARNFGIQQSRGELIQFLDHDDLLEEGKISAQVKAYHQFGNDWLYSGRMGSVSGDQCELDEGYEIYERDFSPREYYETVLNQFSRYITTGAWLAPRKLVESTHGWDGRAGLNDDGEYFMRLITNSKGIRYCEDAKFFFRRDVEGSLSKKKESKEVYEKWLFSYLSYAKRFKEVFDPESARELSWKALSVYYCDAYPYYPELREECLKHIRLLGYKRAHPHGGDTLVRIAKWIGIDRALKLWAWKQGLKAGSENKEETS